jgi:hypothetical protein
MDDPPLVQGMDDIRQAFEERHELLEPHRAVRE